MINDSSNNKLSVTQACQTGSVIKSSEHYINWSAQIHISSSTKGINVFSNSKKTKITIEKNVKRR